jgi:DNA-directed RNA polymerase specialized sigma24 family protein
VTTSVRRAGAGGTKPTVAQLVPPEALEEFYRRLFMPLVRRASWKHGLSKEDARDIVQEAFLLAVSKMDPNGNPQAWLAGVVDRLALGFRRKRARRAYLTARWGYKAGATESDSEPGGEA